MKNYSRLPRFILLLSGIMSLPSAAHTADTTCSGVLRDQRVVGVSLGNCDLNSLSEKEFQEIVRVCGQPNGVGDDANNTTCHIRVIAVPKKNFSWA
jgi:hypothetical protein